MKDRAGTSSRRLRPIAVALLTCSLGVASLLAGPIASAGASGKPSPPLPLDLIAQVGQIANAANATEAQLLSADARIRNGLNGTTAGYVYAIVSDSVQALVGPLKELVKTARDLRKDVVDAGKDDAATTAAWTKESAADLAYIASTNSTGSAAWGGTCWNSPPLIPAILPACPPAAVKVVGDFTTSPNIRVCPAPPAGTETVCHAALTGMTAYQKVSSDDEDLFVDLYEASTAARAIVGDAKDYPGNKLFEAIVQVLGEHRLTKALGKLTSFVSPLRVVASAKITALQSCYDSGQEMAEPPWLFTQGDASGPTTPAAAGACP